MYSTAVRKAFEDCPLIEIVHFHECLRGELRSLRSNVAQLRSQVRDTALTCWQCVVVRVLSQQSTCCFTWCVCSALGQKAVLFCMLLATCIDDHALDISSMILLLTQYILYLHATGLCYGAAARRPE
jgi:hypothetical protein